MTYSTLPAARKLVAISLLTLGFSAGAANAADAAAPAPAAHGDAAAGATKAATCTACHGLNGNSVNPEWPNLAGQSPAYVAEQLHLFKAKVRVNPIMQPIVDPLTPEDFKQR